MSESKTVKVSEHFQITIPPTVCDQLKLQPGDRLLVEVQDNLLILLSEPKNYTTQLQGLHREIWESIDTEEYLGGERSAWET